MVRRVLLVAFQYPPMTGTSGIQRALRFSQYLTDFGWEPMVLTAHPRAYENTSDDQCDDIPPGIVVKRTFALDAARHLSVGGRYPGVLARPDRWISWWPSAVACGLQLIRRLRPCAIWSTFPIPTAHRIGLSLQRRSGLPWFADFRDVMTEKGYPADPVVWRVWRKLEQETITRSTRAIFTTPGAAEMYRQRYTACPAQRFVTIENGYDEKLFDQIDTKIDSAARRDSRGPFVLLHSGVIYPSERDPTQFFRALRELMDEGTLAGQLRIVLRATGHDSHIGALIERFRLQGTVELAPAIPYRDSLREMLTADGLLLLQARNCDRQIPAKLYEYLRSGRPILALASGDTENAVRSAGIDTVAPLDSVVEIKWVITRYIRLLAERRAPTASPEARARHGRRHKALELANMLDAVCA